MYNSADEIGAHQVILETENQQEPSFPSGVYDASYAALAFASLAMSTQTQWWEEKGVRQPFSSCGFQEWVVNQVRELQPVYFRNEIRARRGSRCS